MNSGHYGFPNILGLLRATNIKVLGKAGATAGAGLAGGTTGGAPTSGQFDVGDAVVGQDGTLFICTASGSPGTWTQVSGLSNPLTAKGDLIAGGTAGAATRLGVGSDNQVLTADASQGLGVKWAVTAANAGGALTQIAQTTLGSSAASVSFSGIAGTYSALRVVYVARTTSANAEDDLQLQVNGDTAAHYDSVYILGANASVTAGESGATSTAPIGATTGGGAPAGYPSVGEFIIPGYAGTTFHKMAIGLSVFRGAAASGNIKQYNLAVHWLSTAAITSLLLQPAGGSFAAGSTFTLYGLS